MKHQRTTRTRFSLWLFAGILALTSGATAHGQSAEPFKLFREYVGLNDQEIAIRNGRPQAKIVESRAPDELFVFGTVYVESTPDKYLKFASDVDSLRKLPNYLAIQKFSNPPRLSDLERLHYESRGYQGLEEL